MVCQALSVIMFHGMFTLDIVCHLAYYLRITNFKKGKIMDEILTKIDIAEHQKVSKRTVERWMRDKGLPYYKTDAIGLVRFKRDLYLEWCRKTFKSSKSNNKTLIGCINEAPNTNPFDKTKKG